MPKRPGTPPPVWQTSEDRDFREIERRNAEREAREDEASVPQDEDFSADTKPTHIDRYRSDEAYRELWDRVSAIKNADRGAIRVVADSVTATSAVAEDLATLKQKMHTVDLLIKFGKWIVGLLLAALVGNVAVAFAKVYDKAEAEGEMRIRIQHLETAVERLQDRLQAPRVPFSLTPSSPGGGP